MAYVAGERKKRRLLSVLIGHDRASLTPRFDF